MEHYQPPQVEKVAYTLAIACQSVWVLHKL